MRKIILLFPIIITMMLLLDPWDSMWGGLGNKHLKFFTLYLLLMASIVNMKFLCSVDLVQQNGFFKLVFYVLLGIIVFLSTLDFYLTNHDLANTFASRILIYFVSLIYFCVISVFFSKKPFQLRAFFKFIGYFANFCATFMFGVIVTKWLGYSSLNKLNHIYHEEAFVFIFSMFFTWFFVHNKIVRLMIITVSVISLLLLEKNTSYLLLLFSVYVFFLIKFDRKKLYNKLILLVLILFFSVVLLVVFYYVYMYYQQYLPSGSPGVRLQTYSYRIKEFFCSPLYGTLFHSEIIFNLQTLTGEIEVPSHSDFLDILANGGIIFTFFWIVYPFILAVSNLFSGTLVPERFIISVTWLSIFIVLFFNPVINQPTIGFLYWLTAFSLLFGERENYLRRVDINLGMVIPTKNTGDQK